MPSFASAPELAKKTLLSPVRVHSAFATDTIGAVVNRLDTCMSLCACSLMALMMVSLLYPRQQTPMPEVRSM